MRRTPPVHRPPEPPQPPARIAAVAVAIALLSYSVLAYEVILLRIFSVMLSYHFAFAIVSSVLLGAGVGGLLLKSWRAWFPRCGLGTAASGYAVLVVLVTLAAPRIVAAMGSASAAGSFWIALVLALLPFVVSGIVMAGIFQRFPRKGSILYGCDLLGASTAALTVVALLDRMDAVSAAMIPALVAAGGALCLLAAERERLAAGIVALGVSLCLAALAIAVPAVREVPIANDPLKDMHALLSDPRAGASIVETRWSAFGRTDLVASPRNPYEMALFIDGGAGTPMYNLPAILGDPERAETFLFDQSLFFPFFFLASGEKDTALVIGPGGGRDVLVALRGGVTEVTAVEVNPQIVEIVRDYETYNGGIYTRASNVRVVVAEGRSYLRSSRQRFDLIMLALPITKSSRSVEGYALTENFLFTTEAMEEYLDHLTPEGRLVIATHEEPEIYRLIVLALSAFERRNVAAPEAMRHLYTVAAPQMPAVVIGREAFGRDEMAARHRALHDLGYDRRPFFFVPVVAEEAAGSLWPSPDERLAAVAEGRLSVDQLVRSADVDLRPVTDDSPFFYKIRKGLPQPFGAFLVIVLAGVAILIAAVLIPPRSRSSPVALVRDLAAAPGLKINLVLFSLLGAGFMLIEVALFQRLALHLGNPLSSLTVLLFSLLLGTGIGSLCSSRITTRLRRTVVVASLSVAVAAPLAAVFLAVPFGIGLSPTLTAILILLPLGFALGFPFPVSLRRMEAAGLGGRVNVMWGANGIASMTGSSLAMILGILAGFTFSFLLGAVCYVGVAVMSALLRDR